ncbi:hypothetical protein R3W88_022676 [Solanum pinnatisectum]|uniref:Uncharacterized protein n=1 Tax=Solanum pinnatisectum TaxID=50273 RepID=A0AAV9LWB7_9SOLN|nr:hypothetical protein R3W88_022676 [Solanum pinnatisectum]
MGYSHIGSSWVLKTDSDYPTFEKLKTKPSSSTVFSSEKLSVALAKLAAMDSKLDALTISVTQVSEIMFKIIEMKERFDSFKDLLLSTHLQMDKDTSTTIKTSISRKFEEMSTVITNTLSYFMCLR